MLEFRKFLIIGLEKIYVSVRKAELRRQRFFFIAVEQRLDAEYGYKIIYLLEVGCSCYLRKFQTFTGKWSLYLTQFSC